MWENFKHKKFEAYQYIFEHSFFCLDGGRADELKKMLRNMYELGEMLLPLLGMKVVIHYALLVATSK